MKLIALILIISIAFLSTGCDKMKKAVDASPRLAAQVQNIQDSVESSFNTGKIDKVTALKLAHIVKDKLNPAVGHYTNFIEKLVKAYPDRKVPASQWAQASALFRAVEDSAREVLVALGALTPQQSATVGLAIDTFFALLAIIRAGFAEAGQMRGMQTA